MHCRVVGCLWGAGQVISPPPAPVHCQHKCATTLFPARHRCRDVTPREGNARAPLGHRISAGQSLYLSPETDSGAPLGLPDQLLWFMRLTPRLRAKLDCWRKAAVRVRGCGALRRQLACRPRRVRRTCSGSRALTESTLACRRGEGGRLRIGLRDVRLTWSALQLLLFSA
jgi:hypothetical protein